MSTHLQLDMFEKDEIVLLRLEIDKIKASSENVRRGVFSKVTELEKLVKHMSEKIDEKNTSI